MCADLGSDLRLQVALKLLETFPDTTVLNLCGGLIAWYNAGHDLEIDTGDPSEVYTPPEHLERFITREPSAPAAEEGCAEPVDTL